MDISVAIYSYLSDMGFAQFIVLAIFVGTFIGSFSNVVIHRLPDNYGKRVERSL